MSISFTDIAFLKSATLLGTLPAESGLDALVADPTLVFELDPGDVLHGPGEGMAGLYFVVKGSVELVMADAAGNEKIVEFIKAGGVLGEEVLFSKERPSYSARALTEGTVLCLPEEKVDDWVVRFPLFGRRLLALINERIHYFYRDSFTQSTKNATARLVCYLLCGFDHAPRTPDGTYVLPVPMPRKKLAARLGISGEHLSRAFRELRDKGLIVPHPDGYHIPDVPSLSTYVCPAGCDW